jgi:cellobiose phosphorylase
MKLYKTALIFMTLVNAINVQARENKVSPLGEWEKGLYDTPVFSYHGKLPYTVELENGEPAVIHNDPYFLLGNYKFKMFTHISGEYEVVSPERVISRFNKKESTSATVTVNGEKHTLTGVNSIAGNPAKTTRMFGLGYAEYSYNLPGDIILKRVFSVSPSEEINTGTSGVLLSVSIANNGSKEATVNYQEAIEVAYSQISFYDEKQLTYSSRFRQDNKLAKVLFAVKNSENQYPVPDESEKSSEEFFPPIFFMKALNEKTEQVVDDQSILNSNSFVLDPGDQKNMRFIIGYSLDRKDSDINTICDRLENSTFRPNTNSNLSEGAFVKKWKDNLKTFGSEAAPDLQRELFWHNYSLETLATFSHYFEETFIPQGTMYYFSWGMRAAPRDHLQHALAASYTNPELAKSIMRYTLKKSYKNGNIPFLDKGYGHVTSKYMYPSDQQLYFLFAMAEYLRITNDYEFLNEKVSYFSSDESKTLLDRMAEYYRYFKEEVGTGPRGLVKLRNSDWNDLVFYKMDSKYNASFNTNESHMNTTMLVSFFDKLAAELKNASKQDALADEKDELLQFSANIIDYRKNVWQAFLKDHGERSFSKRMYFADKVIGDDNMFLEPQGFLMQIKEYGVDRKKELYDEIQSRILNSEKIGARQVEKIELSEEYFGSRENGGMWYSLNGPLVIGLSTWNMDAAWNLFHKQTLQNQAKQFPKYWTSYWTSFDALDSSLLPSEGLRAQQRFPADMKTTHCAHIHAWLIYEYLYLKEL